MRDIKDLGVWGIFTNFCVLKYILQKRKYYKMYETFCNTFFHCAHKLILRFTIYVILSKKYIFM